MRTIKIVMLLALAIPVLACVEPLTVVQGNVVEYQKDAKLLVVKDEVAPNPELTISLDGAEIGAEPAPGDLVRIAYAGKEGSLKATRVMNLTRQKELTGGGGGH